MLFVDPVEESLLAGIKHPAQWIRIIKRLFSFGHPVQRDKNLFLLRPLALLPKKISVFSFKAINERFVLWQIRRAIAALGLRPIVFLTYQRLDWDYIGKLGELISVYHCTDLFSSFRFANELERKEEVKAERRLIMKCALVFATERELTRITQKLNPKTFYLPNATDAELLKATAASDRRAPDDLRSITRPIIGFVGVLTELNVDYSTLEYAAKKEPQWSFVMIGPIREPELLPRLPNIYYLGSRRREEVASYLAACDVCIIPNPDNEHCLYAFDVKFFEYLAAGKPVVTGPKPALAEYRDLFYESKGKESFSHNLHRALNEDANLLRDRRRAAAARNTWDDRARQMLDKIYEELSSRTKDVRSEAPEARVYQSLKTPDAEALAKESR
jgi:glycosyltransferase involved in cell wall biosynthesis